jgi:hypothetical protein
MKYGYVIAQTSIQWLLTVESQLQYLMTFSEFRGVQIGTVSRLSPCFFTFPLPFIFLCTVGPLPLRCV